MEAKPYSSNGESLLPQLPSQAGRLGTALQSIGLLNFCLATHLQMKGQRPML